MSTPSTRLMMTADAVGGVWTYALEVADGLARAGVATTLVVFGPSPGADQTAAALAVPRLTLIDTNLPLDWMATEPAEILECASALRGLARANRADLIHLNSPSLAALGGFSAPVVGACHSCLATWWAAVKDGPMPEDLRWRTQAVWQGMLACQALVAPSAAFADATARTYELPRPFVVRNGRTPVAWPSPSAREPIIFTSGRLWDEGKNLRVLDEAAARIDAPVYAAGPLDGPNGERRSLGHVQSLGRLTASEIGAWLCRAPIFVSTALYEPFGLGVLEAAQAGCALVLSDIPTFRELWEGAAVFVDPREPRPISETCNHLLRDPGRAARLGLEARARASRYNVETTCSELLEVYRHVDPVRFAASAEEAAA